MKPYVLAGLEGEVSKLSHVTSGRASASFIAGASVGGFVGAGEIDYGEAETLLTEAAIATGLPPAEARRNVRNGLRLGMKTPRIVPGGPRGSNVYQPSQSRQTVATPPLRRPPAHEVVALWRAARPLSTDPDVVRWFYFRYGNRAEQMLHLAELWDLARALPRNGWLPRWAWSTGGTWRETGHITVFKLWDQNGGVVSIRARCIVPGVDPKSLAPAGFSVKGLVLSDPLGAQLLAGEVPDWWHPRTAIISEGETDWLTWAARQGDAYEQGPAYFGVEAGAWSQEIASRIPDGTEIAIRTDHDTAGERYSNQIAESLRGRCPIFRTLADEGAVQ